MQAKPNEFVSALAMFSMQYDRLMYAVSREVSKNGLNPAEGRIIENLRGYPLTQSDLRELTQIERGQLSRAVSNLTSKGLVELSPISPGKWPAYKLTELGWNQSLRLERARNDAIYAMVRSMRRPERKAFIDALEKLGKLKFVDEDTEEHDRVRTAYPGEISQIISNALEFYRGYFPFKFNSQIEGYVLRQFAEACDRTHHHIIVNEWWGNVVGSLILLVDQNSSSARIEGIWFFPGHGDNDTAIRLLNLALQRAKSAGCKTITARIPRNPNWPNVFGWLGWSFVKVENQKIAGQELEFETWMCQAK